MLLAAVSILSAIGAGFAAMYRLFFPKLSILECVAGAAPLGLTLSAWLALLLKSLLFKSYALRCVLFVINTLQFLIGFLALCSICPAAAHWCSYEVAIPLVSRISQPPLCRKFNVGDACPDSQPPELHCFATTHAYVYLKVFLCRSAGIPVSLVITQVCIQLAVAWACCRHLKFPKRHVALMTSSISTIKGPLVLIALISLWFVYIFHTHSLLKDGNGYYVGGSTYGDMPFHLNIINSFLNGVNQHASLFDGFRAVFFADAKLVYPVIPDWHTAVLVASGASFHFALSSVGVLLVSSFLLLLLAFNLRLTGSGIASSLAVLLTLMCGGIGGFVWLFTDFTIAGLFQ